MAIAGLLTKQTPDLSYVIRKGRARGVEITELVNARKASGSR